MGRTITADQIDFGEDVSTPVISNTLRYILPVPALPDGGEPLVQVEGESAGMPFLDRDGRTVEGRGLAFFNPDDGCNTFVRCDGRGVIILGVVDTDQAARLDAKIGSLATVPSELTLADLKEVLRYAEEDLGLIAHNSTREFVGSAMTPVAGEGSDTHGLHRRRADLICRAVYVGGSGHFLGPAATPQVFVDGAVILKVQGSVWLAQCASFEKAYRHPDGRPVSVSELAVQSPKGR